MTKYVALLRGITPGNPSMRNDKLCAVLEELGLHDVRSVISSGNLLFESPATNPSALESMIEAAWPPKLGFASATIVRSYEDLRTLITEKPFGSREHNRSAALNVTFLKRKPAAAATPAMGKGYTIVRTYDGEVCTILDTTAAKTPQLMTDLEKLFGKEITTRTWRTVLRITDKM
jgi:uncharacterized protein (DUF1697 family)